MLKNKLLIGILPFSWYWVSAFTSHPFSTTRSFGIAASKRDLAITVTKDDLVGARDMIDEILDEKNCGPICVRLGKDTPESYCFIFFLKVLYSFLTSDTFAFCFL